MNKLLFSAVSALVVAGIACAGIDTTQFGILHVPSTAAKTIVSVPWLESGTGTDAVKVADLVMTDDLTEGDQLLVYNGGSYAGWVLDSNKTWQPASNATEEGVKYSSGTDDATLARGQAIILVRQNHANGFYIKGKPAASESGSVNLPAGAWTLIAPAKTTSVKLKDLNWSSQKFLKDHLIIDVNGVRTALDWGGNTWIKQGSGDALADNFAIPAGQGMWFYTTDTASKTVSW